MSLTTSKKESSCLTLDDLEGYQIKAARFILNNDRCALWVDMGLGKTVATLTALQTMHAIDEVKRTLIIAPLRVAKHTWPDEIEKWSHVDLSYSVVVGSKKQREAALCKNAQVHVINVESLTWLIERPGARWDYDCVVIDESSLFKSWSSKRFKTLRRVAFQSKKMIQLTGTPASNGLLDIWAQVYLIDKGERLGRTITSYRQKYFESDYMGYKWTPKNESKALIYAKVRDAVLRLDAKDYLNLPGRVFNDVYIDLPDNCTSKYQELERDLYLLLEHEEAVIAANAAVKINKLLQLASGALYHSDMC